MLLFCCKKLVRIIFFWMVKEYISKYNWEGIEFPAGPKDWEKFEQNKKIALNIIFVLYNTEKIRVPYKLKYNHKRKNQVILLIITGGNKQHYIVASNLSALLRGESSNHHGDFYCLNCFNSYTTKNRLKEHEEICNTHNSCHIETPKWVEKILKYNSHNLSWFRMFTKKEQSCQNNPEKSYTEKKS